MKTHLITLLIIGALQGVLFAQTDQMTPVTALASANSQQDTSNIDQKLMLFETQLQLLKNQINDNQTDSLYVELDRLQKEREASGQVSDILENKIEQLQLELGEREKALESMQSNFNLLNQQIGTLSKNLEAESEARIKAEALKKQAQATQDKLKLQTIEKYKSFVLAWWDLGNLLASSTSTAQSLLLFDEGSKAKATWLKIGEYVGIAGGVAGAVMSLASPESGALTAGLSLSLTGLLGTLGKDLQQDKLIENISRNIAFTDEVNAFNNVAQAFRKKATTLYQNTMLNWDSPDWEPSVQNLKDYYSLISVRRDLTVVIRQMKAKAEYLMAFETLTPDGKGRLSELVSRYSSALESWESSESVYLGTYNFLYNLKLQK